METSRFSAVILISFVDTATVFMKAYNGFAVMPSPFVGNINFLLSNDLTLLRGERGDLERGDLSSRGRDVDASEENDVRLVLLRDLHRS